MALGYRGDLWGDLGIPALRDTGLRGYWECLLWLRVVSGVLGWSLVWFRVLRLSLEWFRESLEWDRFGLGSSWDFLGFPKAIWSGQTGPGLGSLCTAVRAGRASRQGCRFSHS